MKAYQKLFRWPNLLIVILTQVLLKVAVFDYIFKGLGIGYPITDFWFILLVISTVFVATAGYIGNDIADIEIDKINRPDRPLASGIISKTQAKTLQLMFEFLGLLLGFAVAYHIGYLRLGGIHLFIVVLMRFYAARLKCRGLIGNLVVAFSSAMVPAIVWIYAMYALFYTQYEVTFYLKLIDSIVAFYVAFAFLFSLIREIVKDMEDFTGDKEQGCKTLAVTVPTKKLKGWVIGLCVFGILLITAFQFRFAIIGLNRFLFIANFVSIDIVLLLHIIPKLIKAKIADDYHKIGNTLKVMMLTGILTMLFLFI